MIPARYFEEPDALGEPTLWHSSDMRPEPQAILCRHAITGPDAEYHWRRIVEAMEAL